MNVNLSGKKFVITKDHLKLMRRFYVSWDDSEFGAPMIDPKRPYGNGDVLGDIHEILMGMEWDYDDRGDMPDSLIESYTKLHRETKTALQIALVTRKFEVGTYETTQSYLQDWEKVS